MRGLIPGNMLSHANQGGPDSGVGSWTGSNATITRESLASYHGTYCWSAVSTATSYALGEMTVTGLTAGGQYMFTSQVMRSTATTVRQCKLSLVFRNSSHVDQLTIDAPYLVTPLSTWTPMQVYGTAPATTTEVAIQVVMSAAVAVGDGFYFDYNCLRENGETPDQHVSLPIRQRMLTTF